MLQWQEIETGIIRQVFMAFLENMNFTIYIFSVNKNLQFYSNKLICIFKFVYDFSAVLTFLNSQCKPYLLKYLNSDS